MPSRVVSRGLRVLLVEDDEGVRRSLQLLLEWNGFEVRAHARSSSITALENLADVHLLVTDYLLEDGNGIDLLAGMRERGWKGRAVLITGVSKQTVEARARAAGFAAILQKPIVRQELISELLG